jgi:hypothetical protein
VLLAVITPVHKLSGYLRDALVSHVFRSGAFPKPTQLWVALYTLPPSDSDPGTELAGNGYARAQLNPGESNWTTPVAGNGTTSNAVEITYPDPTGDWGLVTAWGLFDAPTGGNLLGYSTVTTPATVGLGAHPRFPVGGLTVTFDDGAGALSDYLEAALIDHVFRTAALAKPSTVYAAFFTASPDDTGGGTEVSAGGYARVAIPTGDCYWAAPVGGNGTTSNLTAFQFPTPTADWGTPVAIGLFDAPSGGRLLVWGALTGGRPVRLGDGGPRWAPGSLSFAWG